AGRARRGAGGSCRVASFLGPGRVGRRGVGRVRRAARRNVLGLRRGYFSRLSLASPFEPVMVSLSLPSNLSFSLPSVLAKGPALSLSSPGFSSSVSPSTVYFPLNWNSSANGPIFAFSDGSVTSIPILNVPSLAKSKYMNILSPIFATSIFGSASTFHLPTSLSLFEPHPARQATAPTTR